MSEIGRELRFGNEINTFNNDGGLRPGERVLRIALVISFATMLGIETYLLWKMWQIWGLA
jgi:hypothetical protein